ncbi:glycosyltransferase family 39 protein [Herbiconiux sp. YIM B11900]|uniref:glycosyltransferase family 39 protein n=1 Tax=Herbiconiux sp. YIM B11900 TaxID=3404131 RepID=UPI003F86C287
MIARILASRRTLPIVFAIGVLVRLAVIVFVVPDVQTQWFVPFLQHTFAHPSLDPWQSFLDSGGPADAFPYGPVMLVYYGVAGFLTSWLPDPWATQLGLGLGNLVLELAIWWLVSKWPGVRVRAALILIILSPIVVYAAYVHGQLDLLPTLLMFASAFALKKQRWGASGLLAGLAIASKFSSALMPPLVLIFLLRNARYRGSVKPYLLGLLPGLVLTVAPALLPGYRQMVLETPTSQSIFAYAAALGPGLVIVLLPIVYSALLALQYRSKRGNPDLLVMLIGITLTAVTLLTPASPGWYLWAVPFLAILSVMTSPRSVWLVWGFWLAATVALAYRASAGIWRADATGGPGSADFVEAGPFVNLLGVWGPILATATVVLGAAALIMVYRAGTQRFDEYRLSKMPLSVAISGDSGTGKDTLCVSLANVFGEKATAFLFGDDYHLYERGAPIWEISTHLHPANNDLATMTRDAVSLMRGRPIWGKHYDHARGRFTKQRPIQQRELVVINGLHVLASAEIRKAADLAVFMSMDEGLRRQLKINRDVGERGQSAERVRDSIQRRLSHAEKFIAPQAALADIEFRIESVRPIPEDSPPSSEPIELRLVADIHDFSFTEALQRTLTSLANCPATIEYLDTPGVIRFTVYPELVTAADTAAVAAQLIARPEELFVDEPHWLGKSRGVMQMIVVAALLERRANRWERT